MKTTALTMMMLLSGMLAYSRPNASTVDRTLTVCVMSGTLSGLAMPQATNLASKMFRNIGVTLNWQFSFRSCPADALSLSVSTSTPSMLKPTALAYARPYEGRHIEVFYDRIEVLCPGSLTNIVFAHVIVHEITHVLEGVKRHSMQGVMKSAWDRRDYAQMMKTPLTFDPEDVQLIYLGLATRHQRTLLTQSAEKDVFVPRQW